jgi:hypothetical protein
MPRIAIPWRESMPIDVVRGVPVIQFSPLFRSRGFGAPDSSGAIKEATPPIIHQ